MEYSTQRRNFKNIWVHSDLRRTRGFNAVFRLIIMCHWSVSKFPCFSCDNLSKKKKRSCVQRGGVSFRSKFTGVWDYLILTLLSKSNIPSNACCPFQKKPYDENCNQTASLTYKLPMRRSAILIDISGNENVNRIITSGRIGTILRLQPFGTKYPL